MLRDPSNSRTSQRVNSLWSSPLYYHYHFLLSDGSCDSQNMPNAGICIASLHTSRRDVTTVPVGGPASNTARSLRVALLWPQSALRTPGRSVRSRVLSMPMGRQTRLNVGHDSLVEMTSSAGSCGHGKAVGLCRFFLLSGVAECLKALT